MWWCGVSNGMAADQAAPVTQGVSYVASYTRHMLSLAVGLWQTSAGGTREIRITSIGQMGLRAPDAFDSVPLSYRRLRGPLHLCAAIDSRTDLLGAIVRVDALCP